MELSTKLIVIAAVAFAACVEQDPISYRTYQIPPLAPDGGPADAALEPGHVYLVAARHYEPPAPCDCGTCQDCEVQADGTTPSGRPSDDCPILCLPQGDRTCVWCPCDSQHELVWCAEEIRKEGEE